MAKRKVKCSECGGKFSPGRGMGVHMRAAHGIKGPRADDTSKRRRRRKKADKSRAPTFGARFCPTCGTDMSAVDMAMRVAATVKE